MGGPYRGEVLEFGESVLAHLPEVGKGSGNPAPKLADRCGWARATSQTSIGSEPTKELVEKSRSVRRLAEHSWSEENLRANVEAPQKRHWTSRLQLTLLLLHLQRQDCMKMRRVNPQRSQRKPKRCKGAIRYSDDAWSFELKQRRATHINTGRHFRAETVDEEVINRKANSHLCRRACQKKTDGGKQTRRTTRSCQWRSRDRICLPRWTHSPATRPMWEKIPEMTNQGSQRGA